jgi:hypothetical protein
MEAGGRSASGLSRGAIEMSTRRTFIERLDAFVSVFGSAAAVSAAVEAGRAPRDRHLRTLGIDLTAFRSIGRV